MKYFLKCSSLLLLLSASCDSKVVKPEKIPVPVMNIPGVGLQITQIGENESPYFSSDGTRMLFISRGRSSHSQSQVYEMHLGAWTERRITHHDGNDFNPIYHPKTSEFYYASSTDELKEGTGLEKWVEAAAQGKTSVEDKGVNATEIYESKINGSKIKRLTKSPGLDSDLCGFPDDRHLIFVSNRATKPFIYSIDLQSLKVSRIFADDGVADEREENPALSVDRKHLAWIRINSTNETKVWTATTQGHKAQMANLPPAHYDSPAWNPQGEMLVLSSDLGSEGTHNIVVVNLKSSCVQLVTKASDKTMSTEPQFSPDGKKIVYVSNRTGKNQIYLLDYDPALPCFDKEAPKN